MGAFVCTALHSECPSPIVSMRLRCFWIEQDGGLRSATARPELTIQSESVSSNSAHVRNSEIQVQHICQAQDGGLRSGDTRPELAAQSNGIPSNVAFLCSPNNQAQFISQCQDGGLRSATARPELTVQLKSVCSRCARVHNSDTLVQHICQVQHGGLRSAAARPETTIQSKGSSTSGDFVRNPDAQVQFIAPALDGGLRSATARPEPAGQSIGAYANGICVRNLDSRVSYSSQAQNGGLRSAAARPGLTIDSAHVARVSDTEIQEQDILQVQDGGFQSAAWLMFLQWVMYDYLLQMLCTLGLLFLARSPLVLRNTVQNGSGYGGLRCATARPEPATPLDELYTIKEILRVDSALLWVDPDAADSMGQLVGNKVRDRQFFEAGWQVCIIPRDRCGGKRHADEESQQDGEASDMQVSTLSSPPGLGWELREEEINFLEFDLSSEPAVEGISLEAYDEEKNLGTFHCSH